MKMCYKLLPPRAGELGVYAAGIKHPQKQFALGHRLHPQALLM